LSEEFCYARWDGHPVNKGHALIIPSRHFANYFEATPEERQALWDLVGTVKGMITEKHKPDGFNLGINIGTAAGQSVFHLHIHVIPRYKGDMADPKGGVRGVIPERQKY
jgi:diadenosine tetraphosphate (Ap4A) HIT family hydrolase